MGLQVPKVIFLDRDGRIIAERDTVRTMSAWGRLYRALRDPLPDRQSTASTCRCNGSSRTRDGVTAVFADGARVRGDLLIGADGIRSTVREQMLPQAQPLYAGYVAWRVMLDEKDIPEEIREEIFEHYSFCLPEGELLLGYPVPGRNNEIRKGERAYNIVWYRPVEPTKRLVDLCTDASGRHHAAGIPPPLIRPEVEAAHQAEPRAICVAPQIAEIVVPLKAVLPADLRSRIAAACIRPRGDHRRRRLRRAPARRCRRDQGRARLPQALPTRSRPAATTSILRSRFFSASSSRLAAASWTSAGRRAVYLSAQLKPREQRVGEELPSRHRKRDPRPQCAARQRQAAGGRAQPARSVDKDLLRRRGHRLRAPAKVRGRQRP